MNFKIWMKNLCLAHEVDLLDKITIISTQGNTHSCNADFLINKYYSILECMPEDQSYKKNSITKQLKRGISLQSILMSILRNQVDYVEEHKDMNT